MTMPPPNPQRNSLGFDEFIGILIAFSTIGAILFWTLSRRHEDLNFSFVPVLPMPTTQPTPKSPVAISPTPTLPAETSPAPTLVTPTVTPSESPEVVVPVVPSATPTQRPTQPVTRNVVPVPVPPPAPVVVAARPINFVDVPQDFWARPFIDALSARGIVSGFTGNYFRPDQPVTRAEFATILQAAFDNNPGQRVSEFKDVPADFWAVPAIERATGDRFLKGYPGNVFRPAQQIPRVQVLVALVGGLKLPPPSNAGIQTYQDAAEIPKYATDKVAAATQAKLVVNYPNQNLLRPNQNATRAEVAAIVYQALVQAGKVKPIQSQYIVPPPQ